MKAPIATETPRPGSLRRVVRRLVAVVQSLATKVREAVAFAVAAAIVIMIATVVLTACAALMPARWVIDWSARRERAKSPNDKRSDGSEPFAAARG